MTAAEKLDLLTHPLPGVTLYNILLRNAGWGILWHEEKRVHPHLVVYHYYPTFDEMLDAELKRVGLHGEETAEAAPTVKFDNVAELIDSVKR